jgi:hypothetical protein
VARAVAKAADVAPIIAEIQAAGITTLAGGLQTNSTDAAFRPQPAPPIGNPCKSLGPYAIGLRRPTVRRLVLRRRSKRYVRKLQRA